MSGWREPGLFIDPFTGLAIGVILGILGMCAAIWAAAPSPGPFAP